MYDTGMSNQAHILRVGANGTPNDESDIGEEAILGSLKPFGYIDVKEPFDSLANPLVVDKASALFLCQPSLASASLGMEITTFLLRLAEQADERTGEDVSFEKDRGTRIYSENLLYSICEQCIQTNWSCRDGLHSVLCLMVETLGFAWGKRYENEIMNVALFSKKSVPWEVSVAGVKSFRFFIYLCVRSHGPPRFLQVASTLQPFFFDLLHPLKE
jgi:hypothetical protein